MTGLAVVAFEETTALEQLAQLFQHRRAAAHHDAVGGDIERRLVQVVEELRRGDEVGDAAAVTERLARHGRIIQQLLRQHRPEQFVVAQFCHQLFAIGQLRNLAAAVHQHDVLVALVDVGILDEACERGEAGAGREQQQAFTFDQIVGDQCTGRLAADQDGVTLANPLQL